MLARSNAPASGSFSTISASVSQQLHSFTRLELLA
jgi:hypothetical protein